MGAWIPAIVGLVVLVLSVAACFLVPRGRNSEYSQPVWVGD